MDVTKALLTAAGRGQRTLPLQKVVDRDGAPKSVLQVLCEEVHAAGIERVAVVVRPGDEAGYAEAAAEAPVRLEFVVQPEPLGYAHALACAAEFAAGDAFLHLVGDHLFVPDGAGGIAALVDAARHEAALLSGVLPTRENALPHFGAVGGVRVPGSERLWEVRRVLEKPTPTEAEHALHAPGLRSGHYLCFAGIHVFTPAFYARLVAAVHAVDPASVSLSELLDRACGRERYLAWQLAGQRFDLGQRYGLFAAQLALGLSGRDRELLLEQILEVFVQRDLQRDAGAG